MLFLPVGSQRSSLQNINLAAGVGKETVGDICLTAKLPSFGSILETKSGQSPGPVSHSRVFFPTPLAAAPCVKPHTPAEQRDGHPRSGHGRSSQIFFWVKPLGYQENMTEICGP